MVLCYGSGEALSSFYFWLGGVPGDSLFEWRRLDGWGGGGRVTFGCMWLAFNSALRIDEVGTATWNKILF